MGNGILVVLLALFSASCGGSGGGTPDTSVSTTTKPSDVNYSTASPDTDNIGESQRFDLTGTASGNGESFSISASYSVTRSPDERQGGMLVNVYDAVFVLSVPSQGLTLSSAATTYMAPNGTILFQRLDTGVECYPDSNYRDMPSMVRIGESGVTGSMTCSDGTTLSGSYLVEQSDRNAAWAAVRLFATTSAPLQAVIFEDIVLHISEDGRAHALDITVGDGEISFVLRS